MNKKDDVYILVKSLDRQEKRFFKLYVKLHNPNKLPQYVYLFDVLDKMEQFDKAQMITGLSKVIAGANISQLKQYLKQNIFSALKVYNKKGAYQLKDNEDINTAKIYEPYSSIYSSIGTIGIAIFGNKVTIGIVFLNTGN